MTDAAPEQKAAFTQIASSYAARDPLYQQVMAVLLPVVTSEPGIKQTATYALLPSVDPEWLRYALYYAEVLGQVERRKKGNSYTLWPVGTPLPPSKPRERASPGPKFTAEDRAMRREHWAHRMPQLLANTDRRRYWQFRTVDDGHDHPACQANHMRIERFDSDFWRENNPAKCRRATCRCTIRAYGLRDLDELGIQPPQ